jgi:phage host-nuclease inhibitor protein Gam
MTRPWKVVNDVTGEPLQPALFTLGEIPRTGDDNELKALVARRDEVLKSAARLEAVSADAQAQIRALYQSAAAPINGELSVIAERLTWFVVNRRRSLMSRLGKVISFPGGTIRYRVDQKSLDTPRVTTAIVNFLLVMRGGKRYLTVKWSLNRDALTHASEHVLAKLRPLGVRVVRHEHITVKSDSQDEPTTLVRRPYRVPSRKS